MKQLHGKQLEELWDLLQLLWAIESPGQDLFEPSGKFDTEKLYANCITQGLKNNELAQYCSETLRDSEQTPLWVRKGIIRMANIAGGHGDIYPLIFDNILLVGVCGQIGAGKSYVSQNMSHTLGYAGSTVLSFAKTLKDLCYPAMPAGIQVELDRSVKSQSSKNLPVTGDLTVRDVYEKVGASIRKKDPNFFVKPMYVTFEAHMLITDEPFVYFIDDLRYQNEHDWIKQNGGLIFKVFDANQPECNREVESERDWKTWEYDMIIDNKKNALVSTDSFDLAQQMVTERLKDNQVK